MREKVKKEPWKSMLARLRADPDGNGYPTYRNRYADESDSVAQLYVKLRGNRGHNGPDALTFRILGQGTAWAVGGGRYGRKHAGCDAYWLSMNTLYPKDPDSGMPKPNKNSGKIVGTGARTTHP